ncbi:MAG: glycoside hydrolase family 15 protein [Parachlamydiaceae bacterium]
MATQEADGHFPQNMWDDGKSYWSKVQLDETALPILLAAELHKANYLKKIFPFDFVKRGAGYILKNGPITEQDRWEEAHGLSCYTLAVTIAAFLAAADFLDEIKLKKEADYLRDAADWWNYSIENWLYVKNTSLARQIGVEGYYIRINPSCTVIEDPLKLDLTIANRPIGENVYPAVNIVSIDALSLVRYGLRMADDPHILNTIKVIDALLKTETPRGPVWHRYNEDGYGEKKDGSAFDGTGIGRGWPLLTGERAHYELEAQHHEEVLRLLRVMASMAGTGGLFPEQVWDQADIPEHVLFKGHSTGAAKPLVWAHAEYLSLLRSINDGKTFGMPTQTIERYLKKKNKPKVALWQMKARFNEMPKGLKLRIQLPEKAIIRFSHDAWNSYKEAEMNPNGFDEWYCDIEGGVEFTIYWVDRKEWQGENFSVRFYS